MGSSTRDDGISEQGLAGTVAYIQDNNDRELRAELQRIGAEFQTQTGFLRRNGINRFFATYQPHFNLSDRFVSRISPMSFAITTQDIPSSLWEYDFGLGANIIGERSLSIISFLNPSTEVFLGQKFKTNSAHLWGSIQLNAKWLVQTTYRYGQLIRYTSNPFSGTGQTATLTLTNDHFLSLVTCHYFMLSSCHKPICLVMKIFKKPILTVILIASLISCTELIPDPDFGAYYTKTESEEVFEQFSRTGSYPDIIVDMGNENGKIAFWRGASYLPYWQTKGGDKEYFEELIPRTGNSDVELMPDKVNTFSHVKIIENSSDSVIVHWRYLRSFERGNPDVGVSPAGFVHEYFTFMPNGEVRRTADVNLVKANYIEETGWYDVADWYYYIYPDGVATKQKHLWTSGKRNHEWQESMAIFGPDQHPEQINILISTT